MLFILTGRIVDTRSELGDINFALQQWYYRFSSCSSLFWKLCCFVIWLGFGTNLCYWLRLFCTLVDHSGAISLVWTTRGFYPWFEGFSTLKILVPLFVLLMIYYCCSLIIAPHRFLQVRENYIRCILWYIVCVIVFLIRVASELLVGLYLWWRQMQRWLLWMVQIVICGRAKWKIYYLSRNCIFRSLLHRSQILCLKKNETLSTNMYVVLFGNMLKIMFTIILLMRHMPELCGRRLSLCMLLSRAIINCIC